MEIFFENIFLGEHLLFVSKIAVLTLNCPLIRSNPMKAYFGAAFAQIFTETEYALWKAVLVEVIIIIEAPGAEKNIGPLYFTFAH